MALRVTHVNGDSTFLLTFYPSEADAQSTLSAAGSFSVLVDPWLEGDSTIFHRKFALARHTLPASVRHLSDLPTPHAVVVSQDKTDHCHEPTLKQLDARLPGTVVLAHPAAARRIRGWKYFDASKVVALPTFNDKKPETLIRFSIPPHSPAYEPGEATVAFIPSRFDITGTHNAVGITYRAPGVASSLSGFTAPPVTITLPGSPDSFSTKTAKASGRASNRPTATALPPTPPDSPELCGVRSVSPQRPVMESPTNPAGGRFSKLRAKSYGALRQAAGRASRAGYNNSAEDLRTMASPSPELKRATSPNAKPLPPTPAASSVTSTQREGGAAIKRLSGGGKRPSTLSVIYSPHGVSYPAVRQYASSHLVRSAGLPLTLLLHSFDRVTNAWYLGGNIIAGMPGGIEIARNLLARCWVSAHDEDKENSGVAVLKCVTDKYGPEHVRRILEAQDAGGDTSGAKGVLTDVRKLGVGEEMVLVGA